MGSDVVDVVISSWNAVVVIASPPSPLRSAASSKPLPDNCWYVAFRDRSWEGDVHEDRVLKHPRAMPTKKDKNIILLVLFSHWDHFFVWRRKQDPQLSHIGARTCKIHVQLRC